MSLRNWRYILIFIAFLFCKDFIYLFLKRGEGREKERQRNTDAREKHQSFASCLCPDQGLNLKPRHVPCLGNELATFCFAGRTPDRVTVARASCHSYDIIYWSLLKCHLLYNGWLSVILADSQDKWIFKWYLYIYNHKLNRWSCYKEAEVNIFVVNILSESTVH